ncbi:MAG: threonine synthase [Acidilobaceae archaeon]
MSLVCVSCSLKLEPDLWLFRCPVCGGMLEVRLPENIEIRWNSLRGRGVWRYWELLPIRREVKPVTLGEGGTPLLKAERAGGPEVYVKFEGANPTGSFKDRGMTVGITIAKSLRVGAVAVASTGNTAASAAAYAARAGLRCLVYLPKRGVAKGKLAQALLHGAEVVEIEGSFDQALEEVLDRVISKEAEIYPLNSVNPWRLEGQKTLAFEVVEELGRTPNAVIVPVGNAGNISAIWKGFKELLEVGVIEKTPRMIGVQAEGAAPLAKAWLRKEPKLIPVEEPETVASAIRIGKPINWFKAWRALEESRGTMIVVSDDEILKAQKLLARLEGIGVEPASAAALAGYLKSLNEGLIDRDETVVIVATGHALKDPDSIFRNVD